MSSALTYSNPFSKYNANLMTANEILTYLVQSVLQFPSKRCG